MCPSLEDALDTFSVVLYFDASAGRRRRHVPYRCNRAVMFWSNMLHHSDTFTFKEGYSNRRINWTFMFGAREQQLPWLSN